MATPANMSPQVKTHIKAETKRIAILRIAQPLGQTHRLNLRRLQDGCKAFAKWKKAPGFRFMETAQHPARDIQASDTGCLKLQMA